MLSRGVRSFTRGRVMALVMHGCLSLQNGREERKIGGRKKGRTADRKEAVCARNKVKELGRRRKGAVGGRRKVFFLLLLAEFP